MLSIQTENSSIIIVVQVDSIDATNAAKFKEEVAAFELAGCTKVVLDVQMVKFIDSTGIGALLSLQKRLPEAAGRLSLRHPQPPVLQVIKLLRLDRIFQFE